MVHTLRSIYTEVPKEGVVRSIETASWWGTAQASATKGVPDIRGAFDIRLRTYVAVDPAEIHGVASCRFHKK